MLSRPGETVTAKAALAVLSGNNLHRRPVEGGVDDTTNDGAGPTVPLMEVI